MRLAFMGTPGFAVPALERLVAAGHEIVAVYTQPPRPADRRRVTPSAVHQRALALGLPVRTPARLRDAAEVQAFEALDLDAAVVAAYGLILPPPILAAPRHGCLNIHASLLPRWRGAAPIQRAILAGDQETGVSIMQMEAGLDTGPVHAMQAVPVGEATAGELTEALAALGAELMADVLARLPDSRPVPQPATGATHAPKINKAEARIDWAAPAGEVLRLVRAMAPAPNAFFEREGARVQLLAAAQGEPHPNSAPGTWLGDGLVACGAGSIRMQRVKPAGRAPISADDWARGQRLAPGDLVTGRR